MGDYVAYDAGNNHSYTSPTGTGSSHGNGDSNQTFTSSSSIKWRVLEWDDETGGVMLISEAPIGSFKMVGAIGYLYAEQELNEICKIYGYGTGANINKRFNYLIGDKIEGTTVGTITGSGARSLNVDDVNKICGVTPSTMLCDNYEKGVYISNTYHPTNKQSTGISISADNRTDVYTYYRYTAANYLSNSKEIYKILFRDVSNSSNITYWLASRSVYWDIHTKERSFAARYIEDGDINDRGLGHGNESGFDNYLYKYAIRPVVFLKSNLKTNGKNSNGAWNIIDK